MRIFVLAGNYREAERWAHDTGLGPREFAFIDGPQSIQGTRGVSFIRVGTWAMRRDLQRIEEEILVRDMNEL